MKRLVSALASSFLVVAMPASSAVTFDYLFDDGYPLDSSYDGTVVVGNSVNGYVPFYWTQATGMVSLGRPQYYGSGGIPAVSGDGTVVASSIGAVDSSYTTQGRWTEAGGWQELMPPVPPDGGSIDGSYGNVWGLSGDGQTVVGLYWRPSARAHASIWTEQTGVVDLGGVASDRSSRANGVDHDGSLVVGWVETPQGPWRPAAWDDGQLVLLSEYDPLTANGHGEARGATPDGNRIVGFVKDGPSNRRAAAMWTRTNGTFGPPQVLGHVDGTEPSGLNVAYGASADGSMVVGYCTFDGSPFSSTGFVWTPETGVIDVVQYLGDNGVFLDPNFLIQGLSSITPDGTTIFGYGQILTAPYTRRGFRITRSGLVGVGGTQAPSRLAFSAPRPNPSTTTTRLEFTLPVAARAEVAVFDAAGRHVVTLVRGELPAGPHTITWDGRGQDGRTATPGLYFARLTTPEGTVAQRLVRGR